MVERIASENAKCIKCTIIPQLQKHNEISLQHGDTLVVHVPFQEWGLNMIQEVYNMFEKAFPYNQIMVVDENVTLEVVRNGGK